MKLSDPLKPGEVALVGAGPFGSMETGGLYLLLRVWMPCKSIIRIIIRRLP